VALAANDFQGLTAFIRAIDDAVSGKDCPHSITTCVQDRLCELVRNDGVRLPDYVFEAHPEHYARRELYTSPDLGCSVVAMTWGPGQGTPVHDHCGMWCVESVWSGTIEVVQYELLERNGDRYRFQAQPAVDAGIGTAGSLIPPHEYHTIANDGDDEVAVSVHIYRGEMKQCNVFQQVDGDWYERCSRSLCLDD